VATGKELPPLNGGYLVDGAFSPDGRLVVTRGVNAVCEVATGRRVADLPDEYVRAAAFSRDGRFLAITTPGDAIHVYEVTTWTKRIEFKGHRDPPTALTFAPNGQLLSGSRDTTVLAWDMRAPHGAGPVTLDGAWNDLAKREAAEAIQAEGRFLAASAGTVTYFAENMKPVRALNPRQVRRWLADLDSNKFAAREAASRALAGFDERVTPYLEETLKNADSEEVRARVRRLLEQRRAAAIPAEQLRQIRAVMVLERIGDGEAKRLLQRWAGGPAGARLTMEATAALRRLTGTRMPGISCPDTGSG
jgi:hypothetical protein